MYIIYKATHKPTGKIYVGRTKRKLEFRIGQHWAEYRKLTKFNQFLHETKMEEWIWEIIKAVETLEEAANCELYYIHLWNLYENGLNSRAGANKNTKAAKAASERLKNYRAQNPEPWNKGRKQCYSEETLELMRLAKLKRPSKTTYTEELKLRKSLNAPNRKTIIELKTSQEFTSISAAAKHFNLRREAVRDVVNGKRSHTAGFIFMEKGFEGRRKKDELDCEACDTGRDYFMLQSQLWNEVSHGNNMLCLSCVENRLGRPLKLEDFTDVPVNKGVFGFDAKIWLENR